MAEPFLAEIRIMSFGFAPKGWALCNGQLLGINQNQALFSLLGTQYGGNGQTTFGLPNLMGRVPIHVGNSHNPGETGGQQSHTVLQSEMPLHSHLLNGSSANASAITPAGNVLARGTTAVGANPINYYSQTSSNIVTTKIGTVVNTGGSQPHNNMQPYLVLNFCIALQGIFPSQN